MTQWTSSFAAVVLALLAQPFYCAGQSDATQACSDISDRISNASSVLYACKSKLSCFDKYLT